MKRFFLIFSLAVVAALASASCSEKEDDPTPEPKYDVVSFESSEGLVDPIGGTVELGEAVLAGSLSGGTFQHLYWTKSFGGYESFLQNGVFNGQLIGTSDRSAWLGSYYSTSSYGDYWGGFVLSGTFGTSASAFEYANQFSVWADTGANGTSVCAVAYVDTYTGGYAVPTLELSQARTVGYCYLAPSVMTATYTPLAVAKDEFWYKVIVTGYLGGEKTDAVECRLVNAGTTKAGWTKVDLSGLGKIDKLVFTVDSNDSGQYGVNAPTYFALDEIGFLVEK